MCRESYNLVESNHFIACHNVFCRYQNVIITTTTTTTTTTALLSLLIRKFINYTNFDYIEWCNPMDWLVAVKLCFEIGNAKTLVIFFN